MSDLAAWVRFVTPLLSRGLSASEAQVIVDNVRGNRDQLDTQSKQTLAQISVAYRSFFTRAGAEKWKKLTGIELGARTVRYPKGFLPTQTLAQLRGSLAELKRDLDATFQVRHVAGGKRVEVNRRDGTPIAAERKAAAGPNALGLDVKTAVALKLPRRAVLTALQLPSSETIRDLFGQVTTIARTVGYNDDALAPRDLQDASPELRAVMAYVYRECGTKKLPLRRIRRHLPAALDSLFANKHHRADPVLGPLYARIAGEVMTGVAERYGDEVIRGHSKPAALLTELGFVQSAAQSRLRRLVPGAFPRPTLREIAHLYRRSVEGEFGFRMFYFLSQLSAEEFQEVRVNHPSLFEKTVVDSRYGSGLARQGDEVSSQIGRAKIRKLQAELAAGTPVLEVLHRHSVSRHELATLEEKGLVQVPERRAFSSRGERTRAQAEAIAPRVTRYLREDFLLSWEDIRKRLNQDQKLVAGFGEVSANRLKYLSTSQPGFPSLRSRQEGNALLAAEIRKLRRKQPDLNRKQLYNVLQTKHPRLTRSRYAKLAMIDSSLLPGSVGRRAWITEKDKRAVVREAKRIADRHSGFGVTNIAAKLAPRFNDYSLAALTRLVTENLDQISTRLTTATVYRDESLERKSGVVGRLFDLIQTTAPPGAEPRASLTVLEDALEERGMHPRRPSAFKDYDLRNAKRRNVAISAEVVAEYAQAADRGASVYEILGRVMADYPLLTEAKLYWYRKQWQANPGEFPALKAFFDRKGQLDIEGRGREIASPRFLGGWNVDRALLGEKHEHLIDLVQNAKIPMRLPLVDHVVAEREGTRPLASSNVLCVSHLLGSTVPMMRAMNKLGMVPDRTEIVGSPYGSNRTARAAIAELGFETHVSDLTTAAYRAEVEQALDRIVAKHRENGHKIVVLDDGGLVAEVLHSNPEKYRDVLDAFRIVEQTTGGIQLAEKFKLGVPVINVASARAKKVEARFIGKAVAAKVLQRLDNYELSGKRAVVFGYGSVGKAVAAALRRAGARVTVVETSETRRGEAEAAGFSARASAGAALERTDLVVGATGKQTLSFADLSRLKDGAVIASASSKRNEFDMETLESRATRSPLQPDNPIVTLPTCEYQLDGKKLTVVGDGWPVNFDGDVEDIDAADIQLTRALMLEGALQAASLRIRRSGDHSKWDGLIDFDRSKDEDLLRAFRGLRSGQPAGVIGDPGNWRDLLRNLAGRVLGAASSEDD